MNRITMFRFVLGCGAACVAIAANGQARALDTYPAYMCHVAQHDFPHVLRTVPHGIDNNSGEPNSRNMIITCPVPADDTLLTEVGVTVADANRTDSGMLGEFQTQACTSSLSGLTAACSQFDAQRVPDDRLEFGTGFFVNEPFVLNQLNAQRSGYRYLNVSIPRPSASGNSRFIGYRVR